MKALCITTPDGDLLPYSNELLQAAAHFKGDEDCLEQVRLLLEFEHSRWLVAGDEDFAVTALSKQILFALDNSSTAVWTAGLVGLALWGLDQLGEKPSLSKAQNGVANYLGQRHQHPFAFFDRKQRAFYEKQVSVASSKDAVRRNFNDYKQGLHFCTGLVVANEYLEPSPNFHASDEAAKCYAFTFACFQEFFLKFDFEKRDKRSAPISLKRATWHDNAKFLDAGFILDPTQELMEPLMKACCD